MQNNKKRKTLKNAVVIELNNYPNFIKKGQYVLFYDSDKKEVKNWVRNNLPLESLQGQCCAGHWPSGFDGLAIAKEDIYILGDKNAE